MNICRICGKPSTKSVCKECEVKQQEERVKYVQQINFNVSSKRLSEILCNASHSIGYWASKFVSQKPKEWRECCDEDCAEYGFKIKDSEENKSYTCGPDSVQRGIKVMAEKYPSHFIDIITENDDGETADVLVQCIVFGEVIYG